MNIKFVTPESLERNIKASVHKSGKIGFTIEAANKMKLSTESGIMIGINEDDANDQNLYVVVYAKRNSQTFPVLKAGDYYYVSGKDFFKSLNWDYINDSISFEITSEKIGDVNGFVFKTTIKSRNKE